MKTFLDSIFKRNGDIPRYRLYDTWEPKIENELSLAISSFHADEAFHSVFGEGRCLDESAVAWHFIGWILDRRRNPMAHMVSVRRDKEFKALLSGSLGCGASKGDELRAALMHRDALQVKHPPSDDLSYRKQEYKRLATLHDAVADEQLEDRMRQYSKLDFRSLTDPATPVHFMIQMIAVDPDEQGNGHVRAMLERLIARLKKMPVVEYIEVSTYDKAKAELYEHLGFNPPEEVGNKELQAWALKLPLHG